MIDKTTQNAAKTSYLACFHGLMSYGIMLQGQAPEAKSILPLKKP